ncbi:MerR family transcriptional regulator [Streptomyces boncukensis]|uniref:MerR family transcriptional regulator n=1 Tax=Streptomyces boncukensis TaxID=2711219 RepID=A0A6G4X7Q7_9ACTN|nr:MerR family transcriptional regulator [Streptomyces boncukensis]NGO73576.1 MerR family transcriptional regulator [Streptomyces boncukensis]
MTREGAQGVGELLGIGAFAHASRLSPKALRLYDGLGLLPPAYVDPASGYRYYAPDQLARARLVAWLRRVGMPLARIRDVCAMEGAEAASAVRAYWDGVEADTALRRDLAASLVDHLSGRDTTMTQTVDIQYAALTDTGLVRESNQDAVYAGDTVLAVADGFGADGEGASSAAVGALAEFGRSVPAGGLLGALDDAVRGADRAVRDLGGPESGTTLTALFLDGAQLGLVHIGDSRAYLLRDGGLFRITDDHTHVQRQIDEGRLTAEEGRSHPQRALLLRALGADGEDPAAEVRLRDVHPGDRYLLCSDGLYAVVPDADVRRTLLAADGPADAVRELVRQSNAAGGPDNVACVVADVTPR